MDQSLPKAVASDAAFEKEVEQTLVQIRALQMTLQSDREEIRILQTETRAIIDDVFSMLKAA